MTAAFHNHELSDVPASEFSYPFVAYGMSPFNAFVLSKIILIGELVHLVNQDQDKELRGHAS